MSDSKNNNNMAEWDEKYSQNKYCQLREPCNLLSDLFSDLPKGKALDIACGDGRNAIFLAKNGYDVDALDFSLVGIDLAKKKAAETGVKINFTHVNLEEYVIPNNKYDLMINFYYLQRSLIPQIKKGLKKEGMILFETFTIEQQSIGSPRNPDHLLSPNELLSMFSDFYITFYREGIYFVDEKNKAVASLVGKKNK